jgi:hypothetical protein
MKSILSLTFAAKAMVNPYMGPLLGCLFQNKG